MGYWWVGIFAVVMVGVVIARLRGRSSAGNPGPYHDGGIDPVIHSSMLGGDSSASGHGTDSEAHHGHSHHHNHDSGPSDSGGHDSGGFDGGGDSGGGGDGGGGGGDGG